jgi:hypothetical protein
MFPSGPAAIPDGRRIPVLGKLVKVPIGVGHEVNTNADKTMTIALIANPRNCAHTLLLDMIKFLPTTPNHRVVAKICLQRPTKQ